MKLYNPNGDSALVDKDQYEILIKSGWTVDPPVPKELRLEVESEALTGHVPEEEEEVPKVPRRVKKVIKT